FTFSVYGVPAGFSWTVEPSVDAPFTTGAVPFDALFTKYSAVPLAWPPPVVTVAVRVTGSEYWSGDGEACTADVVDAGAIVNVRGPTSAAGLQFESPGWCAVVEHDPAPVSVTWLALTVHWPEY